MDISKISLEVVSTVVTALGVIDSGAVKIALVVDSDNRLLGTLNDGDIRRALLRKINIKETIEGVYFREPITAKKGSSKEYLLRLCSINKIGQIPIIDTDRKVIDLFVADDELLKRQHEKSCGAYGGGAWNAFKAHD